MMGGGGMCTDARGILVHGSEGGQAEMLSGLGKKDGWLESLRKGSSLDTVSGLLDLSMV